RYPPTMRRWWSTSTRLAAPSMLVGPLPMSASPAAAPGCRSYAGVLNWEGGLATSRRFKNFLRRKIENQVALEKENNAEDLYLAFESSHKKWKLGFSDGKAPQIR